MKALEKDRARRYETADGAGGRTSARHLADEPVARRAAERGATGCASSCAATASAVGAATTVFSLAGGVRVRAGAEVGGGGAGARPRVAAEQLAREEAARAQTEADTAEQVSEFLTNLFEVANPSGRAGAR